MKRVSKNTNLMTKLFIFLFCGLLCVTTGCKKEPSIMANGTTGELTWKLSENGTLTISGTGEIPNYDFGGVLDPWRDYRSIITSIEINDGITSIVNGAFFRCSSLTSINVDNNNTAYSSEDGVLFNKAKTTLIHYPAGKTGAYTIPSSVTDIGNGAFQYCRGLTSITIPNSMTVIGDDTPFGGCSSLTSINVDNSNTVFSSEDGVLFNKTKTTLIIYPAGKTGTYLIPNSVTSIGDNAFSYCTGLTSVTIPNSVTSIGGDAFRSCSSLTSITIPNSVTSIGGGAFGGCTGLTSVTIPDSVTSIEIRTFQYCGGLTSIIIPNSVTSIGWGAFQYCKGLTSITIPNSITSIGNFAFWNCDGLTSVTVGNSVTSIGDNAFSYCSNLISVIIPNSVTSIEGGAFFRCTGLTSVTIGNSVTSIGDNVFSYCTGLTEIINESADPQSIDASVFSLVDISACTLRVPAGSIDAYRAAPVWQDFGNIVAIE